MGRPIADFRVPIGDWPYPNQLIDNPQLAIGNGRTHPLPRGGTDLMPLHRERLGARDHDAGLLEAFLATLVVRKLGNASPLSSLPKTRRHSLLPPVSHDAIYKTMNTLNQESKDHQHHRMIQWPDL